MYVPVKGSPKLSVCLMANAPGSQSMIPRPVTSELTGTLLEMEILRAQPRPTKSETLVLGPSY